MGKKMQVVRSCVCASSARLVRKFQANPCTPGKLTTTFAPGQKASFGEPQKVMRRDLLGSSCRIWLKSVRNSFGRGWVDGRLLLRTRLTTGSDWLKSGSDWLRRDLVLISTWHAVEVSGASSNFSSGGASGCSAGLHQKHLNISELGSRLIALLQMNAKFNSLLILPMPSSQTVTSAKDSMSYIVILFVQAIDTPHDLA